MLKKGGQDVSETADYTQYFFDDTTNYKKLNGFQGQISVLNSVV